MNIKDYEYNGYKLFERDVVMNLNSRVVHNNYQFIIEYRQGVPFKAWSQEILSKDGETWDRWVESNIRSPGMDDQFIRNLTEEDLFTIFL